MPWNGLSKTSGDTCKGHGVDLSEGQALLARRGLGSPLAMRFRNFRAALFLSGPAEADSFRTLRIEAGCLAALLGFDWCAGDLGVE